MIDYTTLEGKYFFFVKMPAVKEALASALIG